MKKLMIFLLAALLTIGSMTAFAAEGSVTYSGDAGKFSVGIARKNFNRVAVCNHFFISPNVTLCTYSTFYIL